MRLSEGCIINNVARLERQEEIDAESEALEIEIKNSPAPEAKKAEAERAPLDEEENSF